MLRSDSNNGKLWEAGESKLLPLYNVAIQNVSTESHQAVYLLCFNIGRCGRTVQFLLCSVSVFVLYLSYGYIQELMFKLPGIQPFGGYLTLLQFFIYSLSKCKTSFGKLTLCTHFFRIPLRIYVQLAFYTVCTMVLSNAAVGYLNYPTLVIFKCCKLIPVLVGGILIQGKRYGIIDATAALFMSVGLILFTLADSQLTPNFSSKGYVMISLALVADAVIGNVQEKTMKIYEASNNEMVLYSYSIGSIFIFIGLLATGELFDAFYFFAEHPIKTYGYALVFSVLGYFGINIVLTLVKRFGALPAVTVTTCRKAVTVVLSFAFFAKPFVRQYVWSGAIVLLGIYLNVYSKNHRNWNAAGAVFVRRLFGAFRKVVFNLRRRRAARSGLLRDL